MTAALFVAVLLLFWRIQHINKKHMASISTLVPRLTALQNKVNTISLDVQRLRDQLASCGEISPEAEALLSNLSSTLDALAINANPTPPSGPLP